MKPLTKLITFGIVTRLIYYLWMIISSHILPSYDLQTLLLGENVSPYLSPFASWDGVHFLSIAKDGYIHEHQHCFFPLYPYVIKLFSFFDLSNINLYIINGVILSFVSCMIGLIVIYQLTKELIGEQFAFKTGIIFCFAPASVFMTSVYTESFYGCLSLLACYYLLQKHNILLSCVFFALSSFVRSNGLINMGFVLYYFVDSVIPFATFPQFKQRPTLKLLINCVLLTISNLGPFVLYVYTASKPFCALNPLPSYCEKSFPNVYSYNQGRYWNQGFMKYWRVEEIPNFLLCAPCCIISLLIGCIYLKNYLMRHPFLYTLLRFKPSENIQINQLNDKKEPKEFMKQNHALVFVVHLLAFIIIGLFCFHAQTLTRFVSACPAFYWGIVWITEQKSFGILRFAVLFYCLFFTFFGELMFASFYPWT